MRQFFSWRFNFCNFIHPAKWITSVINYWIKLTRKTISKTERHLRMFENAGLRSSFFLEKTNTQRMLPRNNISLFCGFEKQSFTIPSLYFFVCFELLSHPRQDKCFVYKLGRHEFAFFCVSSTLCFSRYNVFWNILYLLDRGNIFSSSNLWCW